MTVDGTAAYGTWRNYVVLHQNWSRIGLEDDEGRRAKLGIFPFQIKSGSN